MKTDLFDSRRWSSRGDVRRRRPRDSATGTTGTAAGSCCPAIQKFKIISLLATKVPPVGLVRQVKLLTKPQEFHIPKKGEWKGICIRAIRRLKTALGGKKRVAKRRRDGGTNHRFLYDANDWQPCGRLAIRRVPIRYLICIFIDSWLDRLHDPVVADSTCRTWHSDGHPHDLLIALHRTRDNLRIDTLTHRSALKFPRGVVHSKKILVHPQTNSKKSPKNSNFFRIFLRIQNS